MTPALNTLLQKGAAQERSGLWAEAVLTYEQAYRESLRGRDAAGLREVLIHEGHCRRQGGEHALALELFELALEVGRLHDDPRMVGRALNGFGLIAQAAGELEEAEQMFLSARREGALARADVLQGEAEQNLGILANIRGNLDEAFERYQAGLGHLDRAGSDRGRVAALNNLGMLHVDMGALDSADGFFERALAICERTGDVVHAGLVHINRAELFLARGLPDRARESCDAGFEIFSRLGDAERKAEALKFYGVIYRETGKLALSRNHLEQAIAIAERSNPLLTAETLRELSLVLRAQGHNREALEALNRSRALFVTLQARHDQDDIAQRITKLETDFLSLVRFWGESIEAKDRYTSGHCERVAEYACRLAGEAGIGEREMVWFRMGAFLHDLGKTEVAEEILNKPGRLTDEERAAMERHPVIGDEMLAPVEFPWDIRPMVRSHHERWDGRGYPDGLSEDRIPLSARILRIADVFDALTTARSYRRRLTPQEALAIMEEDVGSFDPEIFALFKRVFPELVGRATQAQAQIPADPAGAA
ncbi:MAG TPA: HD domain-containing phosphohydrolase [Longimicrobium sp.]|nr:HD domain-containing phosphohydrolase [Longimicrobium sp.]